MEGVERLKTVAKELVDTTVIPFHAAVSKPAQRAYLSTLLFGATTLLLLLTSTVAYLLFYYNYVPQIGIERTIHLQFGEGNPYGMAKLGSSLTSLQPYDVTLLLHLPRTPNNLAAGNFMIDLSLLPSSPTSFGPEVLAAPLATSNTTASVLARSRRPTILPYHSPLVDTASTLTGLPWYVTGWKRESEVLKVSMFEGVEFAKGWRNVPQNVKITIEADQKMQFYDVGVIVVAKLGGLRWFLYHHRILSFLIFSSTFWTGSMISMALAWLIMSTYLSSTPDSEPKAEPDSNGAAIKSEPSESDSADHLLTEDLSDTSRTFPTLRQQIPLQYSSQQSRALRRDTEDDVKQEQETKNLQGVAAEADDEDDEAGGAERAWRDSGLGTSLDETDRQSIQRRRPGPGEDP